MTTGCAYCGHEEQKVTHTEAEPSLKAVFFTLKCSSCKSDDVFCFSEKFLVRLIRGNWDNILNTNAAANKHAQITGDENE